MLPRDSHQKSPTEVTSSVRRGTRRPQQAMLCKGFSAVDSDLHGGMRAGYRGLSGYFTVLLKLETAQAICLRWFVTQTHTHHWTSPDTPLLLWDGMEPRVDIYSTPGGGSMKIPRVLSDVIF